MISKNNTKLHLSADGSVEDAPVTRRPSRSLSRRSFAPLLVGVLGFSGLALAPADATHLDTLHALEVFAPDHPPVTTTTCRARAHVPDMEPRSNLPAGTTASVVVEGAFRGTSGRGPCRTWWIGGVPVSVQSGTRLPETRPPRGRLLRVVTAAKANRRTKLVAEKVVDRRDSSFGAATVEVAYVNTFVVDEGDDARETMAGCVRILQQDLWTVHVADDESLDQHTLDVSAARAGDEIEPCLGQGDTVMAEFLVAAPPPD